MGGFEDAGEGDALRCEVVGGHDGRAFGFYEISVVFGDLVELVHGLCGFVEEFFDFDVCFGGGFDEEDALDGFHELAGLLGFDLGF